MSIQSISRAAALAAALLSGVAQAQTPPTTPSPAAPSQMPPPGYNPGEMLHDLANPVVAEVEGHSITLADVGDAIRALPASMRELPFDDLYPRVLERLIQEQALVARARRMRLDSDPVVKRHMQAAADHVLENELLNRLVDKSVSEQALLARYHSLYVGKQGPEEADVSVILLSTEEQARKDIAEIAAGADFGAVAKRDSKDASAPTGGSLGFLRQDKLVPEVGAVAFALDPGQVAPNPVHAESGWFVVKVAARRRVPVPGFAEVREQLRHQMMEEGIQQVVQETLANTTVRRFNMNGSDVGLRPDEQEGSTSPRR